MYNFFKWFLVSLFTLTFLSASAFAQPPHRGHHSYHGPLHVGHAPFYNHGYRYNYRYIPPRYSHYHHHESFGKTLLRELLYSPPSYNYYYYTYQPRPKTIYVNGYSYSCRECSFSGNVDCSYTGNYDCCECAKYNLGR